MGRFIWHRALASAILMLMASVFSFGLISAAPGNVAVLIAEMRSQTTTRADIERIEAELGLNDPMVVQYGRWLGKALTGDLGKSLRTEEDVIDKFVERSGPTLVLVAGGVVLTIVFSLTLGFVGALKPGGVVDRTTRAVALLGSSIPSFFTGAMLILIFAVSLGVLPSFGFGGPASWIMPWIAISVVPASLLSRIVRVSLEDAMSRPFAITSASKGFDRRHTLLVDAFPNILPVYLNAAGAQIALMILASMVIEPLFAWQGLGSYFFDSVRFRDLPVVQGCLLLFAACFILLNFAVDIAVALVDPRTRRLGMS